MQLPLQKVTFHKRHPVNALKYLMKKWAWKNWKKLKELEREKEPLCRKTECLC